MGSLFCFLLFILFSVASFVCDVNCKHHNRKSKTMDDGKIVGGYNTTIQQVPYQVFLLLEKGNSYYQCGGSILNSRYVLTAAHCLTGIQKAYVRAGSTNTDSGGKTYTSSLLRYHPQYNSQTNDYDVGIIRLSSAITLDGKTTKAVKLASTGSNVAPGTSILVTGWGTTSENGQTSENLMAVKVPAISNQDCRKSYGSTITSRMFCAGVPQGGKDSCQGDSGGPAVNEKTGVQLGVVSFGSGCARAGYPGVYTNVASIRSWIRLNTGV